jgi:predicted DNA-binding transcriptional regulator YafY
MAKDNSRLVRLASVLTQLQSRRMITARDIAEKYGVSIRTVYRDIKILEESGVPVVTEEGRGYSIMDGYRLSPIMFTQEEANALVTAEKIISKNKDHSLTENYQNAVTKIKAVLRNSQKEQIEFLESRLQIRETPKGSKKSRFLSTIQNAITNYQVVEIDYLSLENNRSQRRIEPFALFCTNENWVLVAHCQLRRAFRSFRLDCILEMKFTGTKFEPHAITLSEYFEQCQKKWESTPDISLSQGRVNFAKNQNIRKMEKTTIVPFQVIGISIRTTNENGRAAKEIAELWGRFMNENVLGAIPNKIDGTIYSLYTDYEGDHTQPYSVILGCRVSGLDNIPQGMVGRTFDGGNYVKITARGDLTKGLIVNEWSKIWEMDLDRAFTADFEVFGEKASDPADAEIDFMIAVK